MRRNHILFLYIINTYDFDDLIVPLRHIIYDSPLCLGSDWRGEGSVEATIFFWGVARAVLLLFFAVQSGATADSLLIGRTTRGLLAGTLSFGRVIGHQIQLADFRT